MNQLIAANSAMLETLEQTRIYYARRLVGDHALALPDGRTISLRFLAHETHIFSETIRAGYTPDPAKIVCGPGLDEVRLFSKTRARLLDEILPTVRAPAVCQPAKKQHGVMLFGPQKLSAAQRLAVVVSQDQRSGSWIVRTAFPVAPRDFLNMCRQKGVRWPPK